MKKKTLLALALVLALLPAVAQERVLFVGNSLTFYNDMPQLFKGIAREKGHEVAVEAYTVGGAGLATLLPSEALTRMVRDERWDKVVLQPGTSESVGQSLTSAATAQIIGRFVDMLHATSPEAKVYLYEIGYGIPPGNGNGDYSYYLMAQGIILDTVTRIAQQAGLPFAPAGECFRRHYATHHDLMLHSTFNDIHPSLAGSYLVACAIFQTLYEEPLDTCRFHGGLDSAQAAYLQQVADSVVLPRREEWLMGPAPVVDDPVGLLPAAEESLRAYPNPTTGLLRIDGCAEVLLVDRLGHTYRLDASSGLLDLSRFAPGIYCLQAGNRRHKLVIAHH